MSFQQLRAAFPALERLVWLNTPTVPPASTPVMQAMQRVQREWEEGEFSWQVWEAEAYATRPLFARLIGVPEDTVALMSSMAEAASTVAASLPPGRVVVGEREFRSNFFPWVALEARGTHEVVRVPATDGVVSTEALAAAVDERTVLLAVSEVQSSNGWRVHLPTLAERCRATGARFFVNLTQSLGALRFDASEIRADYVACHGYKWLLGPRGCAWLHVRSDRLDDIRPLIPNWHSVEEPYANYYGEPYELAPGARGLDTSLSWFVWAGARAALEMLSALDPADVERRCLGLVSAFRDAAEGFDTVPHEVPSQTLGVRVPDPDALLTRLKEHSVIAAVRGGFLRLGFHAFNDESDVQAALRALGTAG